MIESQARELKSLQRIYDSNGNGYIFHKLNEEMDLVVHLSAALTGLITLDRLQCRIILPCQTFPLSDNDVEIINRVFGGDPPKLSSVRTINTGGGVMNDIYDSYQNRIIAVHEYGASIYETEECYADNIEMANFTWMNPLFSMRELYQNDKCS